MRKTIPVSIWFVVILTALAPFFKGLFPTSYQLLFTLAALAAVAFHLLSRPRTDADRWHPLDHVVFALALLYLLGIVWGITPRSAIQAGFKQLLYVCGYWLVSRGLRNRADQEWVLRAVALISTAVALGSVILGTGLIPFQDAFYSGRLAGPFQYPNALAGYVLVGFSLTLALRASANKLGARVWWTGALYTVLAVLLLTLSRTAIVLLPGVTLAILWLLPREVRVAGVQGLGTATLGVASSIIPMSLTLRDPGAVLGAWFLLGAAVAVGGEIAMGYTRGLSRAVGVGFGLLVLGAGASLLGFMTRSTAVMARLSAISLSDSSLVLRFWTYRDALTAWWNEAPVLGLGGEGWASIYLTYRSLNVVSRHTHSSLVETLTETGVAGVLLLLAVWAIGLSLAWGMRKTAPGPESRALWTGAIVGVGGLLVHSLFDFDLWYPAIGLLVYILIAVFRASQPTAEAGAYRRARRTPWALYGALGLVGVAVAFNAVLLAAAGLYGKALRQLERGEWEQAKAAFAGAVQYDRLHPTYHVHYGDFLVQYGNQAGEPATVTLGGTMLRRATELDVHNPDYRILLANYLILIGDKEAALVQLEEATRRDPMAAETYVRAATLALEMVVEDVQAGQRDRAAKHLHRSKLILSQFDHNLNRQPDGFPENQLLRETESIKLATALHEALQGNTVRAQALLVPLQRSPDAVVKNEALLWGAALDRAVLGSSVVSAAETELASSNQDAVERRLPVYEAILKEIIVNPLIN